MPKPELTKQLIADTLKKLASTKHLDKISISEIVSTAGLNRQTFYYHFQNKQELICWIFDTDVAALTDKRHNDTLLDDIVEYIASERDFYIDALTSDVQNNLREHIYDFCYRRCVDEIMRILGDRKMDERFIDLDAQFCAHAITGILIQWARDGMPVDNVEFLEICAPLLKEHLRFAIDENAI